MGVVGVVERRPFLAKGATGGWTALVSSLQLRESGCNMRRPPVVLKTTGGRSTFPEIAFVVFGSRSKVPGALGGRSAVDKEDFRRRPEIRSISYTLSSLDGVLSNSRETQPLPILWSRWSGGGRAGSRAGAVEGVMGEG